MELPEITGTLQARGHESRYSTTSNNIDVFSRTLFLSLNVIVGRVTTESIEKIVKK